MIRSEAERTLNKEAQARLDSLVRQTVQTEIEHLINRIDEVETHIVVFDTDKPASDSTRLPPVKAVVRQKSKTKERTEVKTAEQVQTDTEVHQQTAECSREQETTGETAEEKPQFWDSLKRHLLRILLIPVLFIALWLLYKLIKLVRNGK